MSTFHVHRWRMLGVCSVEYLAIFNIQGPGYALSTMCTKNTQFTPGTQTSAATASASNTLGAGRRALSLATVVARIASALILEIIESAQMLEIMLFLMYVYYNSLNLQQLPIPPFKVKLSLFR